MTSILIIVNGLLFFVLAGIHFYWVLGGKLFLASAVPAPFVDRFKNLNTKPTYTIATALVGTVLSLFGVMTLLNLSYFSLGELHTLVVLATRIVAAVFVIRAIGDFKYVGFFKTEKAGQFAKADTQLYNPLCLYLGLSLLLITML